MLARGGAVCAARDIVGESSMGESEWMVRRALLRLARFDGAIARTGRRDQADTAGGVVFMDVCLQNCVSVI